MQRYQEKKSIILLILIQTIYSYHITFQVLLRYTMLFYQCSILNFSNLNRELLKILHIT